MKKTNNKIFSEAIKEKNLFKRFLCSFNWLWDIKGFIGTIKKIIECRCENNKKEK